MPFAASAVLPAHFQECDRPYKPRRTRILKCRPLRGLGIGRIWKPAHISKPNGICTALAIGASANVEVAGINLIDTSAVRTTDHVNFGEPVVLTPSSCQLVKFLVVFIYVTDLRHIHDVSPIWSSSKWMRGMTDACLNWFDKTKSKKPKGTRGLAATIDFWNASNPTASIIFDLCVATAIQGCCEKLVLKQSKVDNLKSALGG